MRVLFFVTCCLALQGCWFIYIPAGLFSGPGVQSKLDKFVQEIESKPAITAIAVAKDASKWAWGGAYQAATEDGARDTALRYCDENRQKESVVSACHLYRIAGRPAP